MESVVDLDLSQIYTNHFMVAVCDYASNMAAYEVNFGGSVRVPDANTTLTAALLNDAGLWFVDVDADDLQSVTTKHATAKEVDLLSAARDGDGTLYVASNEKDSEGHLVSLSVHGERSRLHHDQGGNLGGGLQRHVLGAWGQRWDYAGIVWSLCPGAGSCHRRVSGRLDHYQLYQQCLCRGHCLCGDAAP